MHSLPTALNILLCNLSSFRKHYINKKTLSSLLKYITKIKRCKLNCTAEGFGPQPWQINIYYSI